MNVLLLLALILFILMSIVGGKKGLDLSLLCS